MNLREIIDAFAVIETGLAITHPHAVAIKRVYKYLPPASSAVETPCFMHQYRRMSGSRIVGSRVSDFMIRVQLLVSRIGADTDVWSEVAAAFDEVIVEAFDHDVMLGTSAFQRITTEQQEYQPSIFEWNGIGFIGCEYEYQVTAHQNVTFVA